MAAKPTDYSNAPLAYPGAVRQSRQPSILVDSMGRPMPNPWDTNVYGWTNPTDPLKGVRRETVGVVYRDVPIVNVQTFDINGIRAALQAHEIGQFEGSAYLVDSLIGDDRVQATLGSRTSGVFGQKLIFQAAKDDESGEVLKAWKKAWKRIGSQALMSEIMRWGILMGFSLSEMLWDTTDDELWIPILKPWHPAYTYFRWDLKKYVAISLDGPIEILAGNGKWFNFTPHGYYRGWVQGAVRAIAQPWYMRNLAYRDWARYSEVHGMPIVKAGVPAAGDPLQRQQFIASLSNLGSESILVLPENIDGTKFDINLLEPRDRSWESFKGLIDRCDASIVLPLLGQNLTTEVKEGSFAAARIHGDVRQALLEFDNSTLSEAIYEQIARPFAYLNFGDPDLAPRTCWDIEPPEDIDTGSKAFQAFATGVEMLRRGGYQISPEQLASLAHDYGIKIRASEVSIEAPTTAAGAPMGGGR